MVDNSSQLNLRRGKDYDNWNDCKEFVVKKNRKSRTWYTAYQINDGSNDYQTGDIGYSIARLFRSKDNFCNIETVRKHSFKIRLKRGIYIVHINIDKTEAALNRAINISKYVYDDATWSNFKPVIKHKRF